MRRGAGLRGNVNTLGLRLTGRTGNACGRCAARQCPGRSRNEVVGYPAKEGVRKEREITDTFKCLTFKNGHEI